MSVDLVEVGPASAHVDAVIAATDPYNEEVLAACPRLRAVVRWGTGYDSVDLAATAGQTNIETGTGQDTVELRSARSNSDVTVNTGDGDDEIRIENTSGGNFFISKDEFDPAYPVRAELWGPAAPGSEDIVQLIPMSTRIGRDGSCGTCHVDPASPFSP